MTIEFNPNTISLIVGLGNPGEEYSNTFHNAGKLIINEIVGKQSFSSPKNSFSYTKFGRFIFVVPHTFMNESGTVIQDALIYFKLQPQSLLVIHDDADILLGATKLHFGRGDAGHNGIKSIIKILRTEEFWRFRVGIRKEENTEEKRIKAESFVLSQIQQKEKELLKSSTNTLEKILKL